MIQNMFKNGDDLYIILREITVAQLTKKDGKINAELFNAWKDYLGADKVLKSKERFLFCEIVQEPEWEMVPEEETLPLPPADEI